MLQQHNRIFICFVTCLHQDYPHQQTIQLQALQAPCTAAAALSSCSMSPQHSSAQRSRTVPDHQQQACTAIARGIVFCTTLHTGRERMSDYIPFLTRLNTLPKFKNIMVTIRKALMTEKVIAASKCSFFVKIDGSSYFTRVSWKTGWTPTSHWLAQSEFAWWCMTKSCRQTNSWLCGQLLDSSISRSNAARRDSRKEHLSKT